MGLVISAFIKTPQRQRVTRHVSTTMSNRFARWFLCEQEAAPSPTTSSSKSANDSLNITYVDEYDPARPNDYKFYVREKVGDATCA